MEAFESVIEDLSQSEGILWWSSNFEQGA